MKKLLIVAILMVAGCGGLKTEGVYRSIELKPYINELAVETGHDLSLISFLLAKIDDPDYSLAGGLNVTDAKLIILDVFSFELAKDNNLTFTTSAALAHEYGHYLGLEHNNEKLDDGCPQSIMNEFIYNISEECWRTYKSNYYEELRQDL
jgi:hypothetical protein